MKKNKIKYRWIAQDRNGDIWAYTNKPTLFLPSSLRNEIPSDLMKEILEKLENLNSIFK